VTTRLDPAGGSPGAGAAGGAGQGACAIASSKYRCRGSFLLMKNLATHGACRRETRHHGRGRGVVTARAHGALGTSGAPSTATHARCTTRCPPSANGSVAILCAPRASAAAAARPFARKRFDGCRTDQERKRRAAARVKKLS